MTAPKSARGGRWSGKPNAAPRPASCTARATNERFARRAAEIDAGASGQSLLRHGDAVPSRRGGEGRDQASRPAAEHYQVVVTAGSVGPSRRGALVDWLLVVHVRGGTFDGRRRVASL